MSPSILHRLTDRQRPLDLLREVANGAIYLMSGGAICYPTFEEWNGMGQPAYTDVPSGFLATIASGGGGGRTAAAGPC